MDQLMGDLSREFPAKVINAASTYRDRFKDLDGQLPSPPDELVGSDSSSWEDYKSGIYDLPPKVRDAVARMITVDALPAEEKLRPGYIVTDKFRRYVKKFVRKHPTYQPSLRLR